MSESGPNALNEGTKFQDMVGGAANKRPLANGAAELDPEDTAVKEAIRRNEAIKTLEPVADQYTVEGQNLSRKYNGLGEGFPDQLEFETLAALGFHTVTTIPGESKVVFKGGNAAELPLNFNRDPSSSRAGTSPLSRHGSIITNQGVISI